MFSRLYRRLDNISRKLDMLLSKHDPNILSEENKRLRNKIESLEKQTESLEYTNPEIVKKVPLSHLRHGTSIDKMTRTGLVELLSIKCETIDNRIKRDNILKDKVIKFMGYGDKYACVSIETILEKMLHDLKKNNDN